MFKVHYLCVKSAATAPTKVGYIVDMSWYIWLRPHISVVSVQIPTNMSCSSIDTKKYVDSDIPLLH